MEFVEEGNVTSQDEGFVSQEPGAEPTLATQEDEYSFISQPEAEEQPDTIDWTKDGRYGDMWKDPNGLYKSYRELESKLSELSPYQRQYADLEQRYTQLEQESSQYSQLKNFIDFAQQNPKYAGYLNQFTEYVAQEIKKDQFGDLPDEVVNTLQQFQVMQQELHQYKEQEAIKQNLQKIDSAIAELSDFAKTEGVSFDQTAFLKGFSKWINDMGLQNAPDVSKLMKSFFISHGYDAIKQSIAARQSQSTVKNLYMNRANAAPSSSQTMMAPATSSSLMEKVQSIFQ